MAEIEKTNKKKEKRNSDAYNSFLILAAGQAQDTPLQSGTQ